MTLATVQTRAQLGLQSPPVAVEVHLGAGLPQFSIVGLAAGSVRDSRERVRAALASANFEWPAGRITVNLAPAELPKEGGRYDLAIALGVLAASGQLPAAALADTEFFGELALSGELRATPGMVAVAVHALRGGHAVLMPTAAATEIAIVPGLVGYVARDLGTVVAHLRGAQRLAPLAPTAPAGIPDAPVPELGDVRGHAAAKRALALAAAGGHSLLLIGPPGSGKSMLAARLPGLLPPLTPDEALDCAMLASLARDRGLVAVPRRPAFRAPHHSASAAALIGGGTGLRPGEASLAHHGVLFLDELPEFPRGALEALREPLETGVVTLARAARNAAYPARFQLVAAMNPCPCGYAGDPSGRCRCAPPVIARYVARLSGPLVDRLDLHLEVPRVDFATLATDAAADTPASTAAVAARVLAARARQIERQGCVNSALDAAGTRRHAAADAAGERLLTRAAAALGLSARACHRVLRTARTIADFEDVAQLAAEHVAEAIAYRRLDRRAEPAVAATRS